MNEKKNIERLFQEKFKDFEAVPNEQIWVNIESKLKEKKKRHVIPFWWKLTGVAATLLIGFLITNALFFTDSNQINDVVNQDNNVPTNIQTNVKPLVKPLDKGVKSREEVVNNEAKVINNKSEQNNLSKRSLKSSERDSFKNSDVIVISSKKTEQKNGLVNDFTNKKQKPDSKVSPQSQLNNNQIETANLDKKQNSQQKDNLTEKTFGKNQIVDNNLDNKQNMNLVGSDVEKSSTNQEIKTSKEEKGSKIAVEVKSVNAIKSSEVIVAKNKIQENKNSDTTKIAVVPNALEELLKEKEIQKKSEPKLNRWQVATNVAPIYFSSTTGGSPLDSKFESNDKEFEPSYSYGLGVNYALNKKWNIKTGVNTLAFEYNTNNVVIYQNMNASKIRNVKNNLQGSVLQVENKSATDSPELTLDAGTVKKFDGSLNQKMGYIEIPIEIGYKLIDKKIGVEIITGISSLFLNENSVSAVSSGQSIVIGEANNLNDFHFSGNLGFGFRYRFWKSFNANVNPMFKYQMNTFNTDSGNFKPYLFGLYSGVSYTF